jgi:hypothetical protein
MFAQMVLPRLSKLLCCAAVLLTACCSTQGAGIRRFSLKTTEKLGRELLEQTQHEGPLPEPLRHARHAAKAALPELEKQGYRFIVLNDPEGKGYLVYALATSRDPRDVVVGLHYRLSVSAEKSRASRSARTKFGGDPRQWLLAAERYPPSRILHHLHG